MEQVFRDVSLQLKYHPTPEEISDLEDISEILKDYGLNIRVKDFDSGSSFLFVTLDTLRLDRKTRRGAGRKPSSIYSQRTLTQVTVREVKEMLKTRTQDDVAEEFNISRSTLIRRLRQDDDQYL